ncbi:hypothetical protein I316_01213 [Kwoniella heveanensis BCC8398]|uniref:Phorbol-ester/DAG-type domain-containing protein n=1 Tax=Kwoniella heveanensis BCC8398 TaxID=1296120 RepID=A0A1B9H226_9TREE|nr:hypothetical protein I316_01213 [Kwoniella heveanensis BCC8398]
MSSQREIQANFDARRALGVRPGGQPPPRLYIDPSVSEDLSSSPSLPAPPSPRSLTTSRNVSISIPAFPGILPPPSPTTDLPKRFRRPTISGKNRQPRVQSNRGLYETQKLLSHLLEKLENRDHAPDLLERAALVARDVSGRSKGKGKGKVQKLGHIIAAATAHATGPSTAAALPGHPGLPGAGVGVGSDDFDDKLVLDEGDFDTEAVFDLVEQTKSLLVLAEKQGLDLFTDDRGSIAPNVPILDSTPMKNKRKVGRFSSVTSPIASKPSFSFPPADHHNDSPAPRASTSTSVLGSTLLARILAVLQTLLTVDCLHRTHLFRPLCPPNALQAACLDIAGYLYKKCELETKIRVVSMVIDGFYGMSGMMERVCDWLEGRISELLGRMAKERGGPGKLQDKDMESLGWTDPFSTKSAPNKAVPTFAISTDSQDSLPPPPPSSGWMRYSPTSPSFPFFPPSDIAGLLSTHAMKEVSDEMIATAALIPRILLAITSCIDLSTSKLTTIHRVHRLLSLVLTAKPDSALDLLEIVAHAPSTPRRTALEILSTFYPSSVGHNSVARRLANTTYAALRAKWETGQERALGEDDTEGHHFLPWRFSSKEHVESTPIPKCSTCDTEIHGFILRCTLCKEYRHLHCYHAGGVFQYDIITLSSRDSAPQMVHAKFSLSSPRLDEQVLYGSTPRGNSESTSRKVGQHELVAVNLFNLALCEECHLPLWGVAKQAYACTNGCQRFFHPACLDLMAREDRGECRYGRDVVIDEISAQGTNPFTISLDRLRFSYVRDLQPFCIGTDGLGSKTYDEIAVLYGLVWTQYQLYRNGLSSGSIRITDSSSRKSEGDVLGLKVILKGYEEHMRSRSHEASSAATDFAHVTSRDSPLGMGYVFSERYLTYVTALLRAPSSGSQPDGTHPHTPSDGFLTPQGLPALNESEGNDAAYEMLPISVVSSSLSSDLGIREPIIASAFLDQLRSNGLISLANTLTVKEGYLSSPGKWASFMLPLLMDSSPTVELLISSIEVLLDDLDLALNEVGLRLLVDRAWPSLLCSPYALERLAKGAVSWVMAEDESLLQIVKTYASRHRRLPGVRSTAGQGKVKGESSVNVYKEDRDTLLRRYVEPWLKALHDQDPSLYAGIVYEECKNAAAAGVNVDTVEESNEQVGSRIAGIALERMTAIVDAGVTFTTLMDLLTAWLEDLGALADQDVIYRSLPRLLRRSPSTPDQSDIFALSLSVSQEGPEGLTRACRWMRVLSFSGVEVPWTVLIDLVDLQATTRSSTDARGDLVIAVGANGAPIDAEGFARLCDRIGRGVFKETGRSGGDALSQIELDLVRQTMLLLLRAYGVAVDDVAHTSLNTGGLQAKQPASMSKRRRVTSTWTTFALGSDMVLLAASILERTSYPAEQVLDFLWLLFSKASMVENVDGFIHQSSAKLFEIIWPLVDYDVDRKSRARVLLKMISVNPGSLEKIVRQQLDSGPERRGRVRERLLTLILELADMSLTTELSQWPWPSSAVGLILLFFDAVQDTTEMIPSNLVIVKSILPTHLKAMSKCFEEFLVQSTDDRRLVLLTRLRKLRLSLPLWPIVSWKVIEEMLAEEVAQIAELQPSRNSQAMRAVSDSQSVRCSLLSLGLDMLSAGVPISWSAAQRFQQHVASCLASPWPNPVEGVTALVLPSIRDAIDSSARVTISGQTFDSKTKKTTLVGSIFVYTVVDLASQLEKHDYLTQRTLLDILMVTFFKQNVRPIELSALSALQVIAQFVATTECAENRLLALQILQTAVARMERESVIRAVPSVFATIASVLVKESETDHADSSVLEQSRVFMRSIVKSFGRSGLFLQLFRIDETATSHSIESSTLGRALQLLHASDKSNAELGRPTLFDNVFYNLIDVLKRGRQTLEQVLGSLCRLSESLRVELSEDAAQSECTPFDPNPILKTCAALLDLVQPTSSVTLLHQTSTLLHLCLARFNVRQESTRCLLEVSARIAHAQATEDTARTVIFELAGSAVHGLNVTPTTLYSLLTFLATDAFPQEERESRKVTQAHRVLADSAQGCITILLRTHPTFAVGSIEPETTLGILVTSSMVLCKAEMGVQGTVSQSLGNLTGEAASTQVNVFIFILLASLEVTMGNARARILSLYPLLSRATSLCLRASADLLSLQDTTGDGAELLSLVYAAFRLSILALRDEGFEQAISKDGEDDGMDTLWCRIWPDWYRLLTLSLDTTCVNGPLRAVAHSVFLDTINFLDVTRSPILSRHAGTLSHALAMLVKHQESSGGQTSSKMQRAAQVLDRIASGNTNMRGDRNGLVVSVKKDLGATERIRALRAGGV